MTNLAPCPSTSAPPATGTTPTTSPFRPAISSMKRPTRSMSMWTSPAIIRRLPRKTICSTTNANTLSDRSKFQLTRQPLFGNSKAPSSPTKKAPPFLKGNNRILSRDTFLNCSDSTQPQQSVPHDFRLFLRKGWEASNHILWCLATQTQRQSKSCQTMRNLRLRCPRSLQTPRKIRQRRHCEDRQRIRQSPKILLIRRSYRQAHAH